MAVARVTPTGEKAPTLQRPCVSECVLLRGLVEEAVSSNGLRVEQMRWMDLALDRGMFGGGRARSE
jgi:hypothetical protein